MMPADERGKGARPLSSRRGTESQLSKRGKLSDADAALVYLIFQGAAEIQQKELPILSGPATILPRRPHLAAKRPLPHPNDVKALLRRAVASLKGARALRQLDAQFIEECLDKHLNCGLGLQAAFGYSRRGRSARQHQSQIQTQIQSFQRALAKMRSKRPEFQYLRRAIRLHLEFDLDLEQAFGYKRVTQGRAPMPEMRKREIACAVFHERFIVGKKQQFAAMDAAKKFGINKTQALEAFKEFAGYALTFHKVQRLRSGQNPLWTDEEQERLVKYYGSDSRTLEETLAEVDR
jgi:hypothetical protein